MKSSWLIIIAALVYVSGCANPINQKTAENYHQWGAEAERSGNFELAERNYSRALINAQLAHSPDAGISMVSYNLGRIKGYLCKKVEAEKLLLEALALEEKASGPKSPVITMRLFELARFYYDHGQYEKAEPYFARAIPMVKLYGIEQSDPIGFSNIIQEHAITLRHLNKNGESEAASSEAEALRRNNPNKKAGFVPVRYNNCKT